MTGRPATGIMAGVDTVAVAMIPSGTRPAAGISTVMSSRKTPGAPEAGAD